MDKVSVGGLLIDPISKSELLEQVARKIESGEKVFITTPYSEFLYAILQKPELLHTLNRANFAVADGIGVMWAATYLSQRIKARSYYRSIFEAFGQLVSSLSYILWRPVKVRAIIPEKIVGADLIWDLTELASRQGSSIYLLGGFADTPKIVAEKLIAKFSNLRIVGWSNKGPDDAGVIVDINRAKPDMLLIAYGPIRQELWIIKHLESLSVKLAIGLGGTFDYVAGIKSAPPRFMRALGLEWFWRFFTQPTRFMRIIRATFGLMRALLRYKVFMSRPYRPNVIGIVINQKKEFLVCRRLWKPNIFWNEIQRKRMEDYWQFPQGGVDPGEDVVTATAREIREETGMTSVKLLGTSPHKHSYEWRNATRPLWFNKYKFKGQEQSIIYFKFSGDDSEIKLDNREFDAWQWVSYKNLFDTLHDERKSLVKIVESDKKIWLE